MRGRHPRSIASGARQQLHQVDQECLWRQPAFNMDCGLPIVHVSAFIPAFRSSTTHTPSSLAVMTQTVSPTATQD